MTKDELEKYARDNRKRLAKQVVKLGDVVEVLVGQFAGEKGVIVGIIACGNDYTDPYYEVNMYCEVPDKYKCRKTLITPNNVVGGFSACEFIVCGNRAPEKPTPEIKVGDRVKFKSKEELETMLEPSFWWGIPLIADKEAEIINIPFEDDYRVDIDPSLGGIRREFFDKIPKKQSHADTITIPVKADLDDTFWDAYRAELASKIAVAYAEKGRYKPSEIGEFAVMVANDVVDNLKKQSE